MFAPPHAQIFANAESLILIRQLAFVDDEAYIRPAGADRLENLVERYNDIVEVRSPMSGVRVFSGEPELHREE